MVHQFGEMAEKLTKEEATTQREATIECCKKGGKIVMKSFHAMCG